MKNFASLAMAAVVVLSAVDCSEAQILQRFRNNIREAIGSSAVPQNRPFSAPSPDLRFQPRVSNQSPYVQPQVEVQRPASPLGLSPQRLTPYSQVPPQQRAESNQQQFAREPSLQAPKPITSPATQPTDDMRVRVVTYYDPRSGRTFQRRYLIPGNPSNSTNRPPQGQIAAGRNSIATKSTAENNSMAANTSAVSVPGANTQTRQSLVPPIQFRPKAVAAPANSSPAMLPALAGPDLAAPSLSLVQPIAASIDNSEGSSRVETASVEVEISGEGIPDLSGITVDSAPAESDSFGASLVDSDQEADRQLFFDNDLLDDEPLDDVANDFDEMLEATDDETVEEINYSVLEKFEDE